MRVKYQALIALAVAALIAVLLQMHTAGHTAVQAYTTDNLVRLHVVANSDSPEDQELKLLVRDAILKRMAPAIARAGSAREAYQYLREHESEVSESVVWAMESRGLVQPYRIETGRFAFPERSYGEMLVPAGRYHALRVVLGEGDGKNWWCVLFPPLCLSDMTTSDEQSAKPARPLPAALAPKPASREAVSLVDEDATKRVEVRYRLAILEWAKSQKEYVAAQLARKEQAD